MPPPLVPAELPLTVLFTMLRSPPPPLIPPPLVPAELPLMVLFTMLEPGTRPEPETEIPPPLAPAELPLMVLLATVSEVPTSPKIPPPAPVQKLPLMVQSIIVRYARPPRKFGTATTPPAELPLTVVLRIVAVTTPSSPVML